MKNLPFKTIIDAEFSHSFRYDINLASDYFDDFINDTPMVGVYNTRHDLSAIIVFASEGAKTKKHYSAEQIAEFEENPRALTEEWMRYDPYEAGFVAGDELSDMLADLSDVTAKDYVKMLENADALNELDGFRAFGYSQGYCIDVYFYNDVAKQAHEYIDRAYITNIFYDSPISGKFTITIGGVDEWGVYVDEYMDDCYIYWDKDVKEEVINKICADIVKDEKLLPYSETDRKKLAELAREWLEENVGERLEYE